MNIISYNNKSFDAIIVLHTEIKELEIFEKLQDIPILAADGAAEKLLRNQIIPDFVIGDMDSFHSRAYNYPENRLIVNKDQGINDFEKCLNYSIEKELSDILILGIHGGDYEHSINNWSILSKYSKKMNLTIYENSRYGFCAESSFILPTSIGEKISLIPIKKSKLKTEGLKWELDSEELELSIREGASNLSVANQIIVKIEYGEIFLFCDSKFPKVRVIKNME